MAGLVFLGVAVIKDSILVGVVVGALVLIFVGYAVATMEYCCELMSISSQQVKNFSDFDNYGPLFVLCSGTAMWGFSMQGGVWPFSIMIMVLLFNMLLRVLVVELDCYYKLLLTGVRSKVVGSLPSLAVSKVLR